MAVTQELTETPDWTTEEESMCTKILNEVIEGQVKTYRLR